MRLINVPSQTDPLPGPRCLIGRVSALVPTGEVDRVGLPGGDPSKHPLTTAGALRHRSAVLDLWAGLPSVHGKGQRDQPVSPARRAKDLQSQASVPRTQTFHVSDAKPSADAVAGHQAVDPRLVAKCRLADRRRADCMAPSRLVLVCPSCRADCLVPVTVSVYRREAGPEVFFRRPLARCRGCGRVVVASVIARQRLPKAELIDPPVDADLGEAAR